MRQKKEKLFRYGLRLGMALLLMLMFAGKVSAASIHHSYTGEELTDILQGIVEWQKNQMGLDSDDFLLSASAEYGTDLISDWYAIGMSGCGYEDGAAAYRNALEEKVTAAYQREEKLDEVKATEWHRISLAVLAVGGNPQEFGKDSDGNYIDLIADGTYNRGKTTALEEQGLNACIWALITMDSLNYTVSADAADTREGIIQKILEYQLPDGGFSMSTEAGEQSDPDMTAMAIQALAPYADSKATYEGKEAGTGKAAEKTVGQAIEEGLAALSFMQQPDGDFVSWETENPESTAQVLIALCCLSIDPLKDERFIKEGRTLLDGLMKYRLEQGGFAHTLDTDIVEGDSMASEQAFCAIAALCRYYAGRGSLYNFSERSEEKSLIEYPNLIQLSFQFTKWDAETAKKLPEEVTLNDAEIVQALYHTWELAENRMEYEESGNDLEKYLRILNEIKNEVDEIEVCLLKLRARGPGIRDFVQIQSLWKRVKALSEYDRTQISQMEYLKSIRLKMTGMLVIVLLMVSVILVWGIHRIRKKIQPKKTSVQNQEDDGWES